MFGVGGGFLTTPMLIFYGMPPDGRRRLGRHPDHRRQHLRRARPPPPQGRRLSDGRGDRRRRHRRRAASAASCSGCSRGSARSIPSFCILYVVLLGSIGILMAQGSRRPRSACSSAQSRRARPARRHNPLVAALPLRWRFYRSGLYISPLAPLLLGFVSGILTMLLGVGGGFIMVPAMIYILGMRRRWWSAPRCSRSCS